MALGLARWNATNKKRKPIGLEALLTPSEQAKQAGLNGLAELVSLSSVPKSTLLDWHRDNQTKFKLAIDAALYRKGKEMNKHSKYHPLMRSIELGVMISKEQIKGWLKGRPIQYMNADSNHVWLEDLIHDCIQDLGLAGEWVSVDVKPYCKHELTEWDDDCKNCLFDGFVSDTFIITDGMYTGHGHYRDDGCWTVYKGEHDFMNIDPSEITHYMKLEPPK